MKYFFLPLILLTIISCNKTNIPNSNNNPVVNEDIQEETPAYKECYQFDQRQCMTDSWADNFGLDLDGETKARRMKAWLGTQNVSVNRVVVDMNFHEFTCEACNTCPYEHRFFVELSKKGKADMDKLKLLNLSSCDCSTF